MRMNVVSKTRAHAGHAQMIECFVRSGSRIPRKFTQFRVARANMEAEQAVYWPRKREVNKRSTSL